MKIRVMRILYTNIIKVPITALFIVSLMVGQNPTIGSIKDSLITRFEKIEDYSVEVKISVVIPGLRMPGKRITVYYKKPEKFKIIADGFAIIPKTGIGGNPHQYINMLETLNVVGNEIFHGRKHWKVSGKVIPDSLKIPIEKGKDDIKGIEMNLLVDSQNWVISNVEVFVDLKPVFSVTTDYTSQSGILMPEKTIFKLSLKGMSNWRMRDPFGGQESEMEKFSDIAEKTSSTTKEYAGTITMEFYKYKVNRGLKDKIFTE